MMPARWRHWLLLAALAPAAVAEQLQIGGRDLALSAQARACYLGFIRLYDAAYFRATDPDQRCVRLSYLRGFSAEDLEQATREVFAERHGEAASRDHAALLDEVGRAYRAVAQGDRYTYCVMPDGAGVLLREDDEVVRTGSSDFARRFMQIWVHGEDAAARPQWAFGRC